MTLDHGQIEDIAKAAEQLSESCEPMELHPKTVLAFVTRIRELEEETKKLVFELLQSNDYVNKQRKQFYELETYNQKVMEESGKENARLREALEFYHPIVSQLSCYPYGAGDHDDPSWCDVRCCDYGKRARKALKGSKE